MCSGNVGASYKAGGPPPNRAAGPGPARGAPPVQPEPTERNPPRKGNCWERRGCLRILRAGPPLLSSSLVRGTENQASLSQTPGPAWRPSESPRSGTGTRCGRGRGRSSHLLKASKHAPGRHLLGCHSYLRPPVAAPLGFLGRWPPPSRPGLLHPSDVRRSVFLGTKFAVPPAPEMASHLSRGPGGRSSAGGSERQDERRPDDIIGASEPPGSQGWPRSLGAR